MDKKVLFNYMPSEILFSRRVAKLPKVVSTLQKRKTTFQTKVVFYECIVTIRSHCLMGISKNSFFYFASPLIPFPRKIRGLRQKRGKGKFLEMPLFVFSKNGSQFIRYFTECAEILYRFYYQWHQVGCAFCRIIDPG